MTAAESTPRLLGQPQHEYRISASPNGYQAAVHDHPDVGDQCRPRSVKNGGKFHEPVRRDLQRFLPIGLYRGDHAALRESPKHILNAAARIIGHLDGSTQDGAVRFEFRTVGRACVI